jgi:hypothetical protein
MPARMNAKNILTWNIAWHAPLNAETAQKNAGK